MAATFDAASTATGNGVTSLSWSHTCTGSNRGMVVGVSNYPLRTQAATYNSVSMTSEGQQADPNATDPGEAEQFSLIAPSSGANTVALSWGGASTDVIAGAVSATGCDQTDLCGTQAKAQGTSTTPSVNVSSATGEIVVDCLSAFASAEAPTVGAGQTQRWNAASSNGFLDGAGSTETGAASVTMSWSYPSSHEWALVGISIKAAETPVSGSDTLAPGITDAAAVLAAASSATDALTPSLAEGVALTVSVSVSDALTPSLADLMSVLAAVISAADALTPAIADATASLGIGLAAADALTPALAESAGIAGTLSATDSLTPALAEGVQILVTVIGADSAAPSIADIVSQVSAVINATDAFAPGISDAAASILASLNTADSLAPAIAEAVAIAATVTAGDALAPAIADNLVTLAVVLSAADGLTVSVVDAGAVIAAGGAVAAGELIAIIRIAPALSGSASAQAALDAELKTVPALAGKPTLH